MGFIQSNYKKKGKKTMTIKMQEEKAKLEAESILTEHTAAFMQSAIFTPESEMKLWEVMVNECSGILTRRLLNKEISLTEYNSIRNELAKLLWKLYPNAN
jgi:hypothetical protein